MMIFKFNSLESVNKINKFNRWRYQRSLVQNMRPWEQQPNAKIGSCKVDLLTFLRTLIKNDDIG